MERKLQIVLPSDEYVEAVNNSKYCKNTSKQTQYAVHMFEEFLEKIDMRLSVIIDQLKAPVESTVVDEVMSRFYLSIRNVKKSTFDALRYGLKRYFQENAGIDIVNDPTFSKSKETYQCLIKKLKSDGLAFTSHFPAISENDVKKIISSLDDTTPFKLQYLTWFYIQLYFCRRGGENIRDMKVSDFEILTDDTGRQYLIKSKDEMQKNHRENDVEHSIGGRIYATNKDKCPVKIFQSYLKKLNHSCEFLWQKPKNSFLCSDEYWYEARPVGKNTLGSFMPHISKITGLSRRYTNHSVRVTSCTILGETFSENEIRSVSGHKTNSALGIYKRITNKRKSEMSDHISNKIGCFDIATSSSSDCLDDQICNEAYDLHLKESELDHEQQGRLIFKNCKVTVNVFHK